MPYKIEIQYRIGNRGMQTIEKTVMGSEDKAAHITDRILEILHQNPKVQVWSVDYFRDPTYDDLYGYCGYEIYG